MREWFDGLGEVPCALTTQMARAAQIEELLPVEALRHRTMRYAEKRVTSAVTVTWAAPRVRRGRQVVNMDVYFAKGELRSRMKVKSIRVADSWRNGVEEEAGAMWRHWRRQRESGAMKRMWSALKAIAVDEQRCGKGQLKTLHQ